MENEIRFTNEAKIEFHKAKCFFDYSSKEQEFWDDTLTQLDFILAFPNAFQKRYKTVRIVHLKKFKYSIHYVIKPYGILIYRFLNQNEDY